MNRSLVGRYLIRLIGLFLFVVILVQTDFANMTALVLEIDIIGVGILVLLVIPIMAFKGLRWYVITKGLALHLKAADAVEGLCIAQMTGFSLPGSLGDLVRVPYLKCRGNPSDKSLLSLFIDAIAAAIIPYLIAVVALIEFFGFDAVILLDAALSAILMLTGSYFIYRLIRVLIRPWMLQARLKHLQKDGVVGRFILNLRESIRIIGFPTFIAATLLSGIAWFIYSVQGWLLAQVLLLEISWFHVALALTLTSMLTVLPISIQGIGIREGMFILIFSSVLGVDVSTVVVYSIILTLVSLSPSIYGLISWMRDPFVRLEPRCVEEAITQPIEVFLNIQHLGSEFETVR